MNEAIIAFESGQKTGWTHCNQKDVYFCELCEPSTIKFICCNTIQYVTEDRKCAHSWDSDHPFCVDEFEDNSLLMGYKCNFCDTLDDDRTCKGCGEWTCFFIMACDNAQVESIILVVNSMGFVKFVANTFVMDVMMMRDVFVPNAGVRSVQIVGDSKIICFANCAV